MGNGSLWNRREWLRLGTGALLSLGIWPGCARWRDNGRGGSFRFAVLNDCHFFTAQCPAWFGRVRTQVLGQNPRPEFCVVVGDLSEHGTQIELGAMRDVLRSFGMPYHVAIGNHDHTGSGDRAAWEKLFPEQLNYHSRHKGWQFVGLDSTEGTAWKATRVQSATLQWLDNVLPTLDPADPTVLFTHFPLGSGVSMRPANADDVLARFLDFNLVAVLNGHFHGFTERRAGPTLITTNRCCAISRDNHDGTTAKGFFICDAQAGCLTRQFVQVS